MADTFKEYLIKQQKSPQDTLAQTGIVLGAAVIVVLAFLFGGAFIGPVIILAVLFGAMTVFNRFNKEYEYILTNNELDIDVIFNKAKRKRVITIDMKAIDIMASIHDDRHKHQFNKPSCKVINASDGKNGDDTYAIMTSKDNAYYKILITPNQNFINEIYKQAPHKVFKKI